MAEESANKPAKRKRNGPIPAKINAVDVGKMAYEGARNTDIAEFYGVSEALIRERFCEILRTKRAEQRWHARRALWKKVLEGETQAIIWFGKNYLGERESPITIQGNEAVPVRINFGPASAIPEIPQSSESNEGQ